MQVSTNEGRPGVGRLAFPIFAFMIVEGYYHTHDLRKYVIRLLIGAVLSEIPFNLMYGGSIFYPYHQNVLWTFLLSLECIVLIEKSKKRGRLWLTIPVAVVVTILGTALGFVTMVDYFGFGVLIVLVFYFSADTNGIIMCCMLFDDAPKVLVQKIEQVVKLIRSKGVGIYFVTQSYRKTPGAESDSYVRMYWCGSSPRGS